MPTMSRIGLPRGIVTCLFSDIEGSTRMLREYGADFGDVLARHHQLLRACWDEYEGVEVKTIGDAFFVVFADAENAVAAAIAAQRSLADEDWPGRIRIGMHTGHARPVDGDYTALVVNQAARIVGAARGGQILLTEQTASFLEGSTTDPDRGSTIRPLGRFRVRDFDAAVELCAVTAPGVPSVEGPPRVPPADGHNLPRPTTSLVGRGDDMARLRERLAPARIVTIVGPGGVGKTRLAIETALEVAGAWEDGAWLVDLAPIQEAPLIAEAIGAAVRAPTVAGGERWRELLTHLEEAQGADCPRQLRAPGRGERASGVGADLRLPAGGRPCHRVVVRSEFAASMCTVWHRSFAREPSTSSWIVRLPIPTARWSASSAPSSTACRSRSSSPPRGPRRSRRPRSCARCPARKAWSDPGIRVCPSASGASSGCSIGAWICCHRPLGPFSVG